MKNVTKSYTSQLADIVSMHHPLEVLRIHSCPNMNIPMIKLQLP